MPAAVMASGTTAKNNRPLSPEWRSMTRYSTTTLEQIMNISVCKDGTVATTLKCQKPAMSTRSNQSVDTSIDKYIDGESSMQVAKWGNSLAVRLPAAVVEALWLREGDEIEIRVANSNQFGIARKPGRDELLKRLRAFRGRLPADFRFDRDEANTR